MPAISVFDEVNFALRTRGKPSTAEELARCVSTALDGTCTPGTVVGVLEVFVRYGTVARYGSFYSIPEHPVAGGRFCRESLMLRARSRSHRPLYPWR